MILFDVSYLIEIALLTIFKAHVPFNGNSFCSLIHPQADAKGASANL